MAGSERRPFEQAEDDAAQTEDRQYRSRPVDRAGPGRIAAFLHEEDRKSQHGGCQGDVEEEDSAPAHVFDQPAACDRSDRSSDRAESGPRADRPAAFGIAERGADDGETAWDEKRGPYPLEGSTNDEDGRRGRKPTEDRSTGEPQHAGEKHAFAPELVAERAPDEDERAQEQRVCLNDPLNVRNCCPKVC